MPSAPASDRVAPALERELKARIPLIVDAWMNRKKCRLSGMDMRFIGDPMVPAPSGCTSHAPGEFVGKVCNTVSGTADFPNPTQLGAACDNTCATTMNCQRSMTFTAPAPYFESVTRNYSIASMIPSMNCQLCQMDVALPTYPDYQAVSQIQDGFLFVDSMAAGRGFLANNSCGCCTVRPNFSTCAREQAYMRGALVQAFKRGIQKFMDEELRTGTPWPKIRLRRLERGQVSLCSGMLSEMQGVRRQLYGRTQDYGNMSCSFDPGIVAENARRMFEGGMSISSCMREAVNLYLNMSAYNLAICSALEDAEDFYQQLQPQVDVLIRSHDCPGTTTIPQCLSTLETRILSLISSELARVFAGGAP
jgi:hypothetical protein